MKAILPTFDETLQRPVYLQLYDYIRDAILSGNIKEGEKLPSLRALARSTGLSLTTVENAYNQLLVEGYIYSRPASGYYADKVSGNSDRAPEEKTVAFAEETVPLENHDSETKLLFDPDCFDFTKWKKCMNRVLNENYHTLFFESDPQGELALRYEISQYLYRSRGVSCTPAQIFIGAGTQQITGLLSGILRELDVDHIALETPGYAPVRSTFRERGFAITDVGVDEDGIILDHLPANIKAATYVSPSNNSFTGSVMPIGRRYDMLRWAVANDSYIIEDDYDSELRYFGRPIPPIKSLADEDRVIYLGSFSSTLFAAVRMSYMVLPPQIARDFSAKLSGYPQTCSKLEQLTLANFMETGLYQTHIRKLRKLYSQKLAAVTEILGNEASDFIEIRNNASGISLLLKFREDPDDRGPLVADRIIKDAESLGIPAARSGDLILLYYNRVPLGEITATITDLIRLWRS